MVELRDDFKFALDRVTFARAVGIVPDRWQAELLEGGASRVLLNCSRQAGKSTISAVLALHRALYHPQSLILALAPTERQSKELFSKITAFYRALHGAPPPESDRKLGMMLPNGSRIEALPGTERTIRGFSGASLLLVDEASRVDDGLYFAVKPMLAVSGGSLVMLSSPWGRRGVFYEEWEHGSGWERYRITAEQCPRISPEFLAQERSSLPARIFRQEFMCSFEERDDQVFSAHEIESALSDDVPPMFPNLPSLEEAS